MAGKVNVKFVAILAFVMIALFAGVAATALFVLKKSGQDYINLGDAKAAQNDWKAAQEFYSKAVFRESGNIKFLTKWRDAMGKWVPETQTQLESAYRQNYINCLRQLAVSAKTDTTYWHDYLGMLHRQLAASPFSRDGYEGLVTEANQALRYFEPNAADGASKSLLRYRGLSVVRQMRENLIDERGTEEMDAGLQSLTDALAANPKDAEAAFAVREWHLSRAERARRAAQDDAAVTFFDTGAERNRAWAAANPDDPSAWILAVATEYDLVRKSLVGKTITPALIAEVEATVKALRPQYDALVERLKGIPNEAVTSALLDRFENVELSAARQDRFAASKALVEKALAVNPNDFDMIFRLARIAEIQDNPAESIAQMQRIVDLPPLPVGLDAIRLIERRREAMYQQGVNAFRMHDAAKTDEARADALAKGKQFRARLAEQVAADSPLLTYLDANIAFASRDMMSAQKLLVDYNRATNSANPEALWRLAQASLALGQPGMARTQYQTILERDRDNVSAKMALAQVEMQLQNLARAEELYAEVLNINPDNAAAKSAIELARSLQGKGGEVTDPVARAIINAERVANGTGGVEADPAAAIKILRDALTEKPGETRLTMALAQRLARSGDNAGALEVIRAGLALKPDDANLKAGEIMLAESDPVKRRLALIEQSSAPELDKNLERMALYKAAGQPEKAAEILAELTTSSPDDSRVIEARFVDAIEKKDLNAARQLAQTAEQRDLDKVGGLTFRARMQIIEDRQREAISTLEEASRKGTLNQATWVLLARLQLQNGRSADAIASYGNALSLKPDDVELNIERIRAMASAGQMNEALAAARDAERYGRGNPDFDNLRIALEGQSGNKQQALLERQNRAKSNPEDIPNRMALASLNIDMGQYKPARDVIDELLKTQNTVEMALLEARWYADQNNIAGTARVFQKYLDTAEDAKTSSRPLLSFGQFLFARGQRDAGVELITKAIPLQDPKVMEADKLLGDLLASVDQMGPASESYRRVVDGNADTDGIYRKRLIETLSKAREFDAAEKELTALGDKVDQDPTLMLLRAEVQRGKGDDRGARDTLDRVIQRFPSEFMPYIRRAQLLSDTKAADAEVVSDLEAALRVNPQGWQASMLLSSWYAQKERMDEAVRYARQTIRINPGLDDFRISVMRELLRRNEENLAVEFGDEYLRLKSNDAQALSSIGDVFREAGLHTRSLGYYKQALTLSKQPASAIAVVSAAMSDTPPRLDEAEAALRQMGDQVGTDPTLLMARADVLMRRGRAADAESDLTNALKILPKDNAQAIVTWYIRSRNVFNDNAKHMAYLEKLRGQGSLNEWFNFFKASTMVDAATTEAKTDGLKQLESILGNTDNQAVLLLSNRLRVSTLFTMGRYEDAVAAARQGFEKFPDDWELNNNFAFISSKYLGKHEDALPAAKKATRFAPASPDAWDTLGVVQMRLNDLDAADATLTKALALAGPGPSRVPIQMHLAELAMLKKDKATASDRLDDAAKTLEGFANLRDTYQKDLEELRTRINAM